MIHNIQLRHEDYCCASESCPDDWCSQNCHRQDEQVRVDQDGEVSFCYSVTLARGQVSCYSVALARGQVSFYSVAIFSCGELIMLNKCVVCIRWHLHVDRFVFIRWHLHVDRLVVIGWHVCHSES